RRNPTQAAPRRTKTPYFDTFILFIFEPGILRWIDAHHPYPFARAHQCAAERPHVAANTAMQRWRIFAAKKANCHLVAKSGGRRSPGYLLSVGNTRERSNRRPARLAGRNIHVQVHQTAPAFAVEARVGEIGVNVIGQRISRAGNARGAEFDNWKKMLV